MRVVLPLTAFATLLLLSACSDSGTTTTTSSAATSTPSATPVAAADDGALEPLFGEWGLDPAVCDQTIRISRTSFEGGASACTISGFTDNGDGTYTASMTCTADGESVDEQVKMRPIFSPTGEGIDLTYLNRDNLESTVLRCNIASAQSGG